MNYHQGDLYQRGNGLGGLFAGLLRRVIPMGKAFLNSSSGQALKDIGVKTATGAISDLISGKNIKEAAQDNLIEAKRKIGGLIKRKIEDLGDKQIEGPSSRKRSRKKKRKNRRFDLLDDE